MCAVLEWGQYAIKAFNYVNNSLYAVLKTCEFIACPFIGFFIGYMFSDEGKGKYIQLSILLVNSVIQIINGFLKFIYYFDEAGNYYHGKFYWIYIVFYGWSILFCIIQGIRMMRKYRFKNLHQLIFSVIILMAGIIFQSVTDVWLDFFSLSICGIIIYIFISELMLQTDSITGLYNRRAFDVRMDDLSQKAIITILDIDKFKLCNDLHGHSYGDEVLEKLGKIIYDCFHPYGKCFRIGGDEFAVIITKNIDSYESAFEKLDKQIDDMRKADDKFPTVSYGAAKFNSQDDSSILVFNRADKNMYARKVARKNNEQLENIK